MADTHHLAVLGVWCPHPLFYEGLSPPLDSPVISEERQDWQYGAFSAIMDTMNKTKRNAWHKHMKLDAKMKARKQAEAKAEKK